MWIDFAMIIALFQVILIDIVMSSDNAIMISMTTQSLQKHDRKKAILFGVIGAAIMRIVFAFGLASLLDVPVLKIVGGILLFLVGAKLYRQLKTKTSHQKEHHSGNTRWHALGMIIIADLSMSLDNILAVASAAWEHPIALGIGIAISIVLMMTVATGISRLLDRYPHIQWAWFALIVFLAFKLSFAWIVVLTPAAYHIVLYRIIAMIVAVGAVILHRRYITQYEQEEIGIFLYRHAPFIIMSLLAIIAAFLLYGKELYDRFDLHHAVLFTVFFCIFLLVLEMASLEVIKYKVRMK